MQNQPEDFVPTLITATLSEGRQLAIKLACKTIAVIQPDVNLRKQLRTAYATDTAQLIASAQVVAMEFQTIAQTNNYWRTKA